MTLNPNHDILSLFAPDAEATERIGEELGKRLVPGALVLLFGNLGAGKTTLARGLGRGLEIPTPIQSPTFALIYEHRGRLSLAHMDFYRLDSPDELDTLGLDDYLESEFVVLMEWPEIAMDRLPNSRIEVRLSPEAQGRRVDLHAYGSSISLLTGFDPLPSPP